MRRMKNKVNSKKEREFIALAMRNIQSREQMRQTPEAKQVEQASDALTKSILDATNSAKTVEDLIYYEMTLQRIDELSAQSPQDKTSIENAQRDYRQLSETVAQMRRNPAEYFQANIAFRDTGGDFRKMPRGRIQHIHANATRLRNRAAFVSDEERKVWDARLKLAGKTEDMLRALHNSKVEEHEHGTGE